MILDVNSFLNEYIEESLENIDKISDCLFALSKKQDDKESLEILLRLLHTIKGTSRMMCFNQVEEVVHKLEDVYKLIQNGNLVMTKRIAQLSFSVVKILRDFIPKLSAEETPEIEYFSEIIENITFATNGEEFITDFSTKIKNEVEETEESSNFSEVQSIRVNLSSINEIIRSYDKLITSEFRLKNSFSVLPGIFLALILPLYTPFWMLMLGCFMANIVFKMLFGGFGYNIFNPALIGYVFIIAAFAGSLISNEFNAYYSVGDIFNQTASSTPLTNVMGSATINEETVKFLQFDYDLMVGTYGNLWDFFFGHIPGSLGETSSLLIIISYIYLCIRKTIDWYTPLIYVGVVFALTWGIGAFCGHPDIWYPVFHVCSGGLLFGAVFMATEPVTTPKTPNGKIIFAIFLGLFTVLFRVFGAMEEGVATSILFMCLFSGIIDRFCAKIRVSGLCKQTIGKYALLGTFMLLIVAFIFYKTNSLNPREVLTQTQDLMNNDIILRGGK